MLEILKSGGWLMFPIVLCSILAAAIVAERFWTLRAARLAPAGLIEQVRDWLARDEVRTQLTAMGVDVKAAQARVDSMTPQEVHSMASNMNTMPAGAGIIEVGVLVLLVLVLLDLAGVTDIFPNI